MSLRKKENLLYWESDLYILFVANIQGVGDVWGPQPVSMRKVTITICLLLLPLMGASQGNRVDSLRAAIDTGQESEEMLEQITELSDILISSGRFSEAKEWIDRGLVISNRIDSRQGRFDSYKMLGQLYISREMPDSAIVYTERATRFADSPMDRLELYNLKGTSYSLSRQLILASEQFESAIALADSIGNERYVAGMNLNLGNVYFSLDDNTKALRSFYNALEYAEATGDSLFMATAKNNVGHKFYQMDSEEQAEHYLLRSEKLSRELNLLVNLRRVVLNLGNLYSRLGDYERAEEYYDEALAYAEQSGDTISQIRIHYNRGLMEKRRDQYDESRRLFTLALQMSEDIGNKEGEFRNTTGIGELEMTRGNIQEAIRWFIRANSIVQDDEFASLRLPAYENLYLANKEAGRFRQALNWLESYNDLRSELNSNERASLLAEYETLFDLQRSRQQAELLEAQQKEIESRLNLQRWLFFISLFGGIILLITAVASVRLNHKRREMNRELEESNRQLNEMNATVKEQNAELEETNQIKNKLFAIVAHDLRGPLSSLQSLLYLIRDHDLSESELDEISFTLERNLQENASMMDNLLAWARAQMNGIQLNERNFVMKQAVKSVSDQIRFQAENKGVELKISAPEDIEVFADYDMIKLVIRNLVANAVKFSQKGGDVTVEVNARNGEVEVKVKDEGTGIKEEDQKKLFSREHFTNRGTDNEKGSGLGLMLCKEFVEKHGGRLWFESEVGEGTTFFFTIPVDVKKDNATTEPAFH